MHPLVGLHLSGNTLTPLDDLAPGEGHLGRPVWNARQLQPDITHRVRIRWDKKADTITAAMRIDYAGRILHLLEPPRKIQEERNIELEMLCREAK